MIMINAFKKLKQDGVALVFVILFSAILMVIAIGLTLLVISEIRQVSDIEDATQAFYSAESGIDYALRFVLKGGIVRKEHPDAAVNGKRYCNDTDGSSGPDLYTDGNGDRHYTDVGSMDDGARGRVEWLDLTGYTVSRVVGSETEYFMRLEAVGVSRGVRRRIVVDFTPNCLWQNPDAPLGLPSIWGDRPGVTPDQ